MGIKGMRRLQRYAILSLIFSFSAAGAEPPPTIPNSTYFCIVESSGGVAFDARSQKWQGTVFRPEGKFVLKMEWLKSRVENSKYLGDQRVNDYHVSITQSGGTYPMPCGNGARPDGTVVSIFEGGSFRCEAGLQDYAFNIGTNRFLVAYMVGFISGTDNNENTPAMSAGTCTKIN
jgi:hypothetical protein